MAGGELAQQMRAHDWSGSPLGAPDSWPQSLHTVVGLMLGSQFPMFVAWGPDLGFLYNDAYVEILGAKHPRALGGRFADIWAEIWQDISALVEAAMAGRATFSENLPLVVNRQGFEEQAWFTFSYSPVRDESGAVAGMFCAVAETTGRVLAERAVRAGRDRAQGVLDNMGEAFVLLDRDFRIVDINAEAMRLENRPIEAILGKTHWEAHPDASPELGDLYRRAMRERRAVSLQHRYVWPDGRSSWIDMRAYPAGDGLAVFYRDVTERMQAEERLRESEAQFRGVFDSELAGLTLFDANTGRTMAINDTFLAMTGHSRADFDEGRWDWRDFTVAEFLHLDEAAIAQARERGWWDTYEKEYRRLDGSRFPVRMGSAALPGRPGSVVVSVQDITASRAAEADLRESQQRLRLAQQAAGFGVWDWNLIADAITWSPEMFDLLGVDPGTPPERLFEAWTRAMHPEDRERTAAVVSRAAERGESLSMDFRVIRADGDVHWLRSQATAVRDAQGRPVRLTGINVDVTAQHRVEEELRGETQKLAAVVEERTRERNRIFDLSNELFAAAGFDGYLRTINPAWQTLLGYTEAELLGRPFIDLIHPDDHAAAAGVVSALTQGQAVQVFEDRLVRKDGKVVWVAWTAVPEGDRFYAVGRDVTRERERDEALRQSQKMEAMGQLTGGVAHDFNNLLTPIVGALDMLQRKGLGGEREQRLIDGAAQSAERARTLVQRLLAFARRQPLQSVSVDMGKLVSGMANLVASTTGPQIKVAVEIGQGLPPAKADPNQLEMAVLNLAVNARDAMPEGGTLRISVDAATVGRQHRSKLKPGRYLNLSVADTGTGMDETTLARAVEPFFSTKGIGKGTGLGLSMVHGLASQLGGALTIRSTSGIGTNVELWLPQGEAATFEVAPAPEPDTPPSGKGVVLLVDDEDLVRLSTADMLIELGYDVVEAASAEEALRLLNRGLNPDILVTDHLMPGLSGTDFAVQLRSERRAIKVLVVSGYAETAGIASDLPRLTKPFRSADLAVSLAALG
jgi:PAS domain S-box-containing protein